MKKILCLFDVDGTLTKSRGKIEKNMIDCLYKIKQKVHIAYVGGSDIKKIKQQLSPETCQLAQLIFSQNGLLTFKKDQVYAKKEIKDHFSEEKLQNFINFCLKYIAQLKIPIKRGTFVQYRTGLINVSPIGRNCSQTERDNFQVYDLEHKIRQNFIKVLEKQFQSYNLVFTIGGQISFDVYPKGWDKRYCLQFLTDYDEIYFFGDKTFKGGNDHEIYEHFKPKGTSYSIINGPQQTIKLLNNLFIE